MDPPGAVAVERQEAEGLGAAHGELGVLWAAANRDSPGSPPFVGRHGIPETPSRMIQIDT